MNPNGHLLEPNIHLLEGPDCIACDRCYPGAMISRQGCFAGMPLEAT